MRLASLAVVLAPSLLSLTIACGDDGDSDGGDDGSDDGGDAGSDAGTAVDAGQNDAGGDRDDGGTTVILCGGLVGLTCDDALYCDWPDEVCGEGDVFGECKPRPAECEPGDKPVCGCDGQRHDSACAAAMIGVDVADLSRCETTLQR